MIWQIPPIWQDGECWIIGGGPSVPRVFDVPDDVIQQVLQKQLPVSAYSPYLFRIHDRHVIAVNMAFRLGTWVDLVWFGDSGFYRKNRKELLEFPKPKIGCSARIQNYVEQDNLKWVPKDKRKAYGITTRKNHISWNANSGSSAINLAYHLGCRRIILLGFDMNRIGTQQHWHSEYRASNRPLEDRKLPFSRHSKGFGDIAKDAKRLGVEILNVSPISEIKELQKVKLEDVL